MKIVYLRFSDYLMPEYPSIAREMNRLGHTTLIGSYDQRGDLVFRDGESEVHRIDRSHMAGGPDRTIPTSLLAGRLFDVRLLRKIRPFLIDQRADIVHVNSNNIHSLYALTAFMPPAMKFVIDYRQIAQRHGKNLPGKIHAGLMNARRPFYSRFVFDGATYLSHRAAELALGKDWSKWADIVPAGFDDSFLNYQYSLPPLSEYTAGDAITRFILPGVIQRVRQLERILKASQLVLQQTDRFCVNFVGEDRTGGYYPRLSEEMGLTSVVRFHPPIPYEQVPAYVTGHDVGYVMVPDEPADWRVTHMNKALEYRALGLCVIATDCPPNRDLTIDGVNGLLMPNNEPEEIARAMLRYIQDPHFRAESRKQAVAMRSGLTWAEVARKYEVLYSGLLKS